MLSLQLRTAALALLPLLIWGTYRGLSAERAQLLRPPVEIGVEHGGGARIAVTYSTGGQAQLVDIGNDGREVVHVSIPEDWERGEVHGAPLAQLVTDAPSFGFRRWSIPAGATVSYRAPQGWSGLSIHNPSRELLRIRITTVDLARNTADTEVYLLQDARLDLPRS